MALARERVTTSPVSTVCEALGLARASCYRAQQPVPAANAPRPRAPHPRALTAEEHTEVRTQRNRERFVDRAPRAVSATLLDAGTSRCQWRTL